MAEGASSHCSCQEVHLGAERQAEAEPAYHSAVVARVAQAVVGEEEPSALGVGAVDPAAAAPAVVVVVGPAAEVGTVLGDQWASDASASSPAATNHYAGGSRAVIANA